MHSKTYGAVILELEEDSLLEHGSFFKIFLYLLLVFSSFLDGKELSQEVKEAVAPYLLPDDHPIKPTLDTIFSDRPTFNLESLAKAGFQKAKPRKFTKLIVTRHPELPGYIFKFYLDTQRFYKDSPEHELLIMRAKGAELVRNKIISLGLENIFKVPRKWLYALPATNTMVDSYYPKSFILVVEDMDILSTHENKKMWKSEVITYQLLDYVFILLDELGLDDSAKPDNIPFSKDGRIALIDTEAFDRYPILYKKLNRSLSNSNQQYWKEITRQKSK